MDSLLSGFVAPLSKARARAESLLDVAHWRTNPAVSREVGRPHSSARTEPCGARTDGGEPQLQALVSTIRVTSGGDPMRAGGPAVPNPRFT